MMKRLKSPFDYLEINDKSIHLPTDNFSIKTPMPKDFGANKDEKQKSFSKEKLNQHVAEPTSAKIVVTTGGVWMCL